MLVISLILSFSICEMGIMIPTSHRMEQYNKACSTQNWALHKYLVNGDEGGGGGRDDDPTGGGWEGRRKPMLSL